MKTEAEIRVMQTQAKGHLETADAGRGWEGFSPRAFGGNMVLQAPGLQSSGLHYCERISVCSLKLPDFCYDSQQCTDEILILLL